MARVVSAHRSTQRPPKPAHSQGGKLELRLPRIPADARTFFVVSLLAYTCYDFALHPILHWLLALVWH
jgi:hypothetical protein